MKRYSLSLAPVLLVGLGACQMPAAPARTADANAPAATPASAATPALPAEAGTPVEPAPVAEAPAATTRPTLPPASHPPAPAAPVTAAPAAPVPAPPPTPTPKPRVVAAGTSLPIVLQSALTTKTAKPEDPVAAELAEDVVVDGEVLLPAGSEVRGHVVTAIRSGRVKGKARLVVSFDQVRTEGKTYRIDATGFDLTAGSSKGKDAKIAGGAAAAGVLIGAIADGGSGAVKGGLIGGAAGGAAVLATRGVEVELPANSRHTIELRKSLRLN